MGNDSSITKKSKRKTPPHKKHAVYPGVTLSSDIRVEYGSIKSTSRPPSLASAQGKRKDYSDPVWQAYDKAAINLNSFNSASKAQNNIPERLYELAYRRLVRAKLAPRLKRKYSKN